MRLVRKELWFGQILAVKQMEWGGGGGGGGGCISLQVKKVGFEPFTR